MARQVVCKESELPVGTMKPFKAGDTNILVYHLEDGSPSPSGSCGKPNCAALDIMSRDSQRRQGV